MDCSLPGSSIHGVLQARILQWIAIPFSRGSSRSRNWTQVSCIAGRFFVIWATRETLTIVVEISLFFWSFLFALTFSSRLESLLIPSPIIPHLPTHPHSKSPSQIPFLLAGFSDHMNLPNSQHNHTYLQVHTHTHTHTHTRTHNLHL